MMDFISMNLDDGDTGILFQGSADITSYFEKAGQAPPPQNSTGVEYTQSVDGRMNSDQFVTLDSFEACLQNINQRLSAYGFPVPLQFKKERPDQNDAHILNSIHLLLKQHQLDLDFRSELHDKMSRLRCDNESLHQNCKRLKNKLEQTMRELELLKSRQRSLENQHLSELKKLEMEKEELQRDVKNLIQKQDQYEHRYQRKEREYNQLKERMQNIVNHKGTTSGNSIAAQRIEIVNLLPNHTSNISGIWKNGLARNEDTLYQNIVGAFTDEKNELVSENQLLRQSLKSLNAELNQLKQVIYSSHGFNDEDDSSLHDLSAGQFELPYQMVKDDIEDEIRYKIEQVSQILHMSKSKISDNQDLENVETLGSTRISET
jgi:myosin heavy subunit